MKFHIKQFNFKSNPDKVQVGYIAHELQEVLPDAVSGEKDATIKVGNIVNSSGDILEEGVAQPDYALPEDSSWVETGVKDVHQKVKDGLLMPYVVAALKEQIEKNKELEARLILLESK